MYDPDDQTNDGDSNDTPLRFPDPTVDRDGFDQVPDDIAREFLEKSR